MLKKLIVLLLLSVLLVACGAAEEEPEVIAVPVAPSPTDVLPTAIPTETPNLMATVEVIVEATVQAMRADVAVTAEANTEETIVEEETPVVDAETTNVATGVDVAAEEAATVPIQVGINAEFEPFVYVEGEEVVGFDIDLLTALAIGSALEITFIRMPFPQLIEMVESGELDAAISAITITPERAERVDFTNPYFSTGNAPVSYFSAGQGLVVRIDSSIQGAADLVDVAVGVKDGTTGAAYVRDETGAQEAVFAEIVDALVALGNGEIEAVVGDIPVLVDYIKENPNAGLRLAGGPLTSEEYGIMVNKNRTDVRDMFNGALERAQLDGVYDEIFNKWFGQP